MWMLFHRNAKTKHVRDGESFVEKCPDCGRIATFSEVEVSESYGVFFVDLVGDKERAFRCGACGEVFDLRDRDVPAAASKPKSKTLDELAEEARVDEQRRLAAAEARKAAAEAKAIRVDDELAELKKRMGR
jgi:uncharacterized C2H2 Zn-finger protein